MGRVQEGWYEGVRGGYGEEGISGLTRNLEALGVWILEVDGDKLEKWGVLQGFWGKIWI